MTMWPAELDREGDPASCTSVREKVVGSFCDVFETSVVAVTGAI